MLAGTGRESTLILRKMCIILDKLVTAVLAAPIFFVHTGMLYLVIKYLVYIRAGSSVKPQISSATNVAFISNSNLIYLVSC